jgi:hypothetical protein
MSYGESYIGCNLSIYFNLMVILYTIKLCYTKEVCYQFKKK